MRLAVVSLGLMLCVSSARADELAAAPTTPARATPDEAEEQPAPVTAPDPEPAAFEPEGQAEPAPEAPSPPPPPPPPERSQRFRRWTPEEIARVRAALARQREQLRTTVHHTPGDSRAHFTVGLELSEVYRPDLGFERFQHGQWSPRFGIFAAVDLVRLQERLALFAEVGAALENDESPDLLGPGTSADLSSQTLQLGVGLRWEALSWLSPHVRVSGGASLFQLDVKGTNVAYETGHATSVLGALGAGFIVHTPARTFETDEGKLAALRMGLLVEAGYALRSSIDFSLHTQADPRRIDVIDASLGSLSLSGAYLRFAAVLRF